MRLPLSQGLYTIIDDEDFEIVGKLKWTASKSAHDIYAIRFDGTHGRRRKVYLHRLLMHEPKGLQVHHKNGNSLDNRRTNLEVCSQEQNLDFRRYK